MRRIVIMLIITCFAVSAAAQDYRYWISGEAGSVSPLSQRSDLTGLDFGDHAYFGGSVGLRVGEGWLLGADATYTKLTNTIEGADMEVGLETFEATRFGGMLHRLMFPTNSRFNLSLGWGGGMMLWKVKDPSGNIASATGDLGQPVKFEASELFGSAGLNMYLRVAAPLMLRAVWTIDYLTGAGTSFSSSINSDRPRWFGNVGLSLNLLFGSVTHREKWASDSSWQTDHAPVPAAKASVIDSDGDGVQDALDSCLGTPRGVIVDRKGCPVDSDGDGVPDGLDDCPGTTAEARGRVDIYGCPVDSDFDGIPDYIDACPNNPAGAQVDARGCPVDSDADGVADGLDDCPNTLPGIPVDKYGCIDATVFAKPMILRPDYEPGSFEVDAKTKTKLEQLARALSLLPEIRLEINAFTDDIGTDAANQTLSERRANRVKEFLAVYGVAKERMTTVGHGESNALASNQTAEGRAKNRRIEIVFHK